MESLYDTQVSSEVQRTSLEWMSWEDNSELWFICSVYPPFWKWTRENWVEISPSIKSYAHLCTQFIQVSNPLIQKQKESTEIIIHAFDLWLANKVFGCLKKLDRATAWQNVFIPTYPNQIKSNHRIAYNLRWACNVIQNNNGNSKDNYYDYDYL